jgi:hypothetical protein
VLFEIFDQIHWHDFVDKSAQVKVWILPNMFFNII